MSEKFSLKWNDYQSNWNKSLYHLRKDTDFADVTLISDDKVKFFAHKVLLSSCSNMFKMILKENINASPLLYLGGVSAVNLRFLLDYIYNGEVNLFQEQLDSFLESAQKLEIEGLMGQEGIAEDQETSNENKLEQEEKIVYSTAETKQIVRMNDNATTRRQYQRPSTSDVANVDVTSMTPEQIEEKMKELYQKIDGVWTCTACDYATTTNSSNIRMHVERHIDGLSYSCNLCQQDFRSRAILNRHKYTVHTKLYGQNRG